ncbi:MAG: ORF6N domain-containing protein [Gallionella sp.]|nr:ORF6N domain-containing protein [Gallionella sp.]
MTDKQALVAMANIETKILLIRGQKLMLDADLAELYEVETKELNRAMKRNIERFPEYFMFQLSAEEFDNLRFQFGTSSLKSQIGASRWGGRRYPPYAFTEQGVAMLSSVLRSSRAIQVNIAIMRTFVQLRQMLSTNAELSRKLVAMEKNYDIKFKAIFEAIHQLMTPTDSKKKRPIGFAPWEKNDAIALIKGINTVIMSAFIPRYGAQHGHSPSYQPGSGYGSSLSVSRTQNSQTS